MHYFCQKISKIGVAGCQIYKAKMHQIRFRLGSVLSVAFLKLTASSRHSAPLAAHPSASDSATDWHCAIDSFTYLLTYLLTFATLNVFLATPPLAVEMLFLFASLLGNDIGDNFGRRKQQQYTVRAGRQRAALGRNCVQGCSVPIAYRALSGRTGVRA